MTIAEALLMHTGCTALHELIGRKFQFAYGQGDIIGGTISGYQHTESWIHLFLNGQPEVVVGWPGKDGVILYTRKAIPEMVSFAEKNRFSEERTWAIRFFDHKNEYVHPHYKERAYRNSEARVWIEGTIQFF